MTTQFSDAELQIITAAAAEMRGLMEAEQRSGVAFAFKKSSAQAPGKIVLADNVVDIKQATPSDFARAAVITQITGQHTKAPLVLLSQFEDHYEDMIVAVEVKVAQDMGLYTPDEP